MLGHGWLFLKAVNWEKYRRFLSVPKSTITVPGIGIHICQDDGVRVNHTHTSTLTHRDTDNSPICLRSYQAPHRKYKSYFLWLWLNWNKMKTKALISRLKCSYNRFQYDMSKKKSVRHVILPQEAILVWAIKSTDFPMKIYITVIPLKYIYPRFYSVVHLIFGDWTRTWCLYVTCYALENQMCVRYSSFWKTNRHLNPVSCFSVT